MIKRRWFILFCFLFACLKMEEMKTDVFIIRFRALDNAHNRNCWLRVHCRNILHTFPQG